MRDKYKSRVIQTDHDLKVLVSLIQREVREHLDECLEEWPPHVDAHHSFAILKEEVDELWEAVRMKQTDPERHDQLRKEAIQVAAASMRFILDICTIQKGGSK